MRCDWRDEWMLFHQNSFSLRISKVPLLVEWWLTCTCPGKRFTSRVASSVLGVFRQPVMLSGLCVSVNMLVLPVLENWEGQRRSHWISSGTRELIDASNLCFCLSLISWFDQLIREKRDEISSNSDTFAFQRTFFLFEFSMPVASLLELNSVSIIVNQSLQNSISLYVLIFYLFITT